MTSAALASRFRSAPPEDSASDLNQIIAHAEQSILEVLGSDVSVQFALSASVTRVALPSRELERIVLGLCATARSVLGAGGRIVLETRGLNDAPLTTPSSESVPADARACVIARAEHLGHAPPAAPCVSTAAELEFGFASMERLLERFDGRLEFVPLSGNDLAYVAYLPYAPSPQSSSRLVAATPEGASVILLIEDEPQVRAVTARMLRAFGYGVLTASNERTALAQAEVFGASIALVVSDLVLPGVSGTDLVRRLRTPCEHARVLYISGYSQEQAGTLTEGACFLRKPFTAQELQGAVRGLLPESVL